MKTNLKLYVSIIALLGCARASYEEKRISKMKVPEAVVSYIRKEYPATKGEKYYIKHHKDTVFYAAEFKHQNEKLDLTFFANGELFEIEKEVAFESLPEAARSQISKELSSRFEKYIILQVEFVNPHQVTQYELNVKGKSGKIEKFYEIHFNGQGVMIKFKEIVLTPIQTMF